MTWNTNITPSNQTVKLKINMLTRQIKLECINKEEEEEDKSSSSRHYTQKFNQQIKISMNMKMQAWKEHELTQQHNNKRQTTLYTKLNANI